MKKLILLLTFILLTVSSGLSQTNEPLTDEMNDLLKSDPFNVGILLQSTANYSFKDDGFNNGRSFGLGVGRLSFNGELDNNFNYRFQMDFLNQPSILDLALGYQFTDQFQLVAGAQKPDIGLDLRPSPGDTDFINRARLIGNMLNSREIGVSAQGQVDNLDYNISVFNGLGLRTFGNDDHFMYLAKIGYNIDLDADQTLYVGGNGFLNTTQNEPVGNTGFTSTGDRITYGIFADYDSNSWFAAAELMMTNFETNIGGTLFDETITGFYTTIGHKLDESNELLGRWEHQTFSEFENALGRPFNLFTLGWNHQATSLISFQVNALAEFSDNDESFGLSGNFQFQF